MRSGLSGHDPITARFSCSRLSVSDSQGKTQQASQHATVAIRLTSRRMNPNQGGE